MRVIDEDLLDEFRRKRCEWCHGLSPAEPHHFYARGMGGGGRVDMPWNLIALCRLCHNDAHLGLIYRPEILQYIADREGTTPEWITVEYHRILRLPKDASPPVREHPRPALPTQVPFAPSFPRPDGLALDEGKQGA